MENALPFSNIVGGVSKLGCLWLRRQFFMPRHFVKWDRKSSKLWYVRCAQQYFSLTEEGERVGGWEWIRKRRAPLCETIYRFFHFLSPRFSVTSVRQNFSISQNEAWIYSVPAQFAANKEQQKSNLAVVCRTPTGNKFSPCSASKSQYMVKI